jgi:hypothetical protein
MRLSIKTGHRSWLHRACKFPELSNCLVNFRTSRLISNFNQSYIPASSVINQIPELAVTYAYVAELGIEVHQRVKFMSATMV